MVEPAPRLDLTHATIAFLQHGAEEAFLVAEIVVQHALAGVRPRRDFVDARPVVSVGGELLGRDFDDVVPDALRILDPTCRPRFCCWLCRLAPHGLSLPPETSAL